MARDQIFNFLWLFFEFNQPQTEIKKIQKNGLRLSLRMNSCLELLFMKIIVSFANDRLLMWQFDT